ncbi:MAG: DUF4259 domain-containing protein [Opitutaceae bacterium]
MGAWGHHTFENDDAGDWLYDFLDTEDLSAIESAFSPEDLDYLESPDGCMILAASEVVLGLTKSPRETIPEALKKWIESHKALDATAYTSKSINLLERVLAPNSELFELWEENEDLFPQWKADVEDMIKALKG